MGRGKIEIKKIENANSRQVTFSKRRGGLFKKANELAILCDADVAVIVYSNTGKLFEFSSSSMKKILSRYTKCIGSVNAPSKAIKSENEDSAEVDALKEEIEKLKSKHMQLLGKDLTGLSLSDLHELEQQLNEGFICIKEKKEQLLMQEIAESRMLEQRAVQENETLRRQIEEFKDFCPSTNQPAPLSVDYGSMENNSIVLKRASESPGTECNDDLADEDSNTTLCLGPSTMVFRKRKTPDGETHSSNSETPVKFSL